MTAVATVGPISARDGARLHVTEWGKGPPVVLTHAWGLSGRMWDYQVPSLVDAGYSCIVPDRRGHGRSDVTASGYDLDNLTDDLAAIIDALGLDDVVLVGHSAGAQEIVRYTTRHGRSRIGGLVLSAPITPCVLQRADFPLGIPESAFEAIRTTWLADFGAWVRDNTETYFGSAQVSAPLVDSTVRMLMDTPLPVILETHRTLTRADLRGDLAELAVAVTVIQGTLDASAPLEATGRPTAELIDSAALVVIDGAGHGLYQGHAKQYNEVLLEAVRSARTAVPSTVAGARDAPRPRR